MRISFFSFLLILALGSSAPAATSDGWRVIRSYGAMQTGIGTAPGAGARQVFHVTLPPQKGRRFRAAGYVEKRIPAEPWRGQRVRLSLLLKNQGGMNPWVTVAVRDTDTNGILSRPQGNSDGGDAWTVYQYVMDVPANADAILVRVGFPRDTIAGTSWIDGPILKAVGKDVPFSLFHRYIATAPYCFSLGCIDEDGHSAPNARSPASSRGYLPFFRASQGVSPTVRPAKPAASK
jgi:hypothetical protein